MSQYSVLELQNIVEICQQYGIQSVKAFSILRGGSENTNYLIITGSQRFVLTICEQKTFKSAQDLTYLLEHLSENGFSTSKVRRTLSNGLTSEWNGKPVLLKVFLEGQVVENLPPHILEIVGIQIGKLHKIEAPSFLPKVLSYGIEQFHEVQNYAPGSSFAMWLDDIRAYIQPYLSQNLPKSLIHSDIFSSNIVVSKDGNSACIMDFEEAANYYRIFDIGMSLVGLCCDEGIFNKSNAKILLKGYQRELDLNEIEKNALQAFTVYAAASMTFWRHRNFNHTNPNPEMFDHYLGLKVIADSVKNTPASDFSRILY